MIWDYTDHLWFRCWVPKLIALIYMTDTEEKIYAFVGAESHTVGLGPRGLPLIPLPLRGAQREVITLSLNRKPHQKRIMFLHKPVKERAAEPDGDLLLVHH